MATTQSKPDPDLTDRLVTFLRTYYREDVLELANRYPSDQKSLPIDWGDLHQGAPDVADDYLTAPERLRDYLEDALVAFDIPADIDLSGAHVRVHGLPEAHTHHPGEFSPTEEAGHYRAITGEVAKVTDVYSRIVEAAFECQLCGVHTTVPQSDGDFQEPHECQGCERDGPFEIDFDQSAFVDAQKLRVKTPPEIAEGSGKSIDAFVEDDLAGVATIGDRVTITGTVHLEQQTANREPTGAFDPYLDGVHITLEETDQQDLDVSSEERARIRDLAEGAEGDPLDVAAASLAPKIYGYGVEKKALLLAMVSGGRVAYPTGDTDRANVHVLLLGDPGTAKSKLIGRAQTLGWRTVGVSSKRATGPGLTVAAEQDDFGGGEWSLKAGAFVKANGGTVCIDELDDMPPDTRAAMLEPMATQQINATVAGENATFQTEAAVVAAGNPEQGRFEPYEPIPVQFGFDSTLLSRFDLIFTMTDQPDPEEDREIATHMLESRDAAKRWDRDNGVDDEGAARIEPPVEADLMRKWIALAKRRPNPPFASESVQADLRENYLELRGLYDPDDGSPVPVTFRNLEGIVRVAEAVAKFHLADEITDEHARLACEIVGKSMEDVGKNEDGELDADIQETGQSKSQRDRKNILADVIAELGEDYEDGVPREVVVEHVTEELGRDYDPDRLHTDMDSMLHGTGVAIEPRTGRIRYLGRG